jgi:hypothetical protein
MDDGFLSGPKFTGDLSDHLSKREEPPDRWIDRLRHSWLLYAVLAVLVPTWIGLMVVAVVFGGKGGIYIAFLILLAPLGIYIRMLQWRLVTGRDVNTGERIDRPSR